ncbi:hypothetical protein [Cedecea sp.]|jgi:hypothetical protein|uniref:hypothetical protein n=1 Tax=Cedecea sp. TaxID=1970739 RepID=UPI0012AD745B|nr:hypothetical protein [Enterobacteriaceae bacterium RIT693]
MSKTLIICAVLFATHVYAANKPASELVWSEAEEEPGCHGNVCLSNEEKKPQNMYGKLDKGDQKLLSDPYSKYDRDGGSGTARAGVTFKWDE